MNVSRDWHYPDETYQKLGYMVSGNTVERRNLLRRFFKRSSKSAKLF